jgi:hypothetical protein
VFNLLSGVAFQSNTPYLWAQVFEGGIGGLLCRFRPKVEPHPKNVRAALLSIYAEHQNAVPKSAGDYGAMDEEGKTIVAGDAEVSVVAAYAAKMSIDILSKRQPSAFPYSAYLIGLSKAWMFTEPFHTIPVDLSKIPTSPPSTRLSEQEETEQAKFIKGLLNHNVS